MASDSAEFNKNDPISHVLNCLLGRSNAALSKDQLHLAEFIASAISLDNLDQEKQYLSANINGSQVDEWVQAYCESREELRMKLTEGNMGVPELIRCESKIVKVGARKHQRAHVNLHFDDETSLSLELDARSLEKLLASIKEAQSEAERAIAGLQSS